MKTNWQKTRVMRRGRKQGMCIVDVHWQKIEQVEAMKYLGAMISSDGSMDSEVEQRIGMASKMIGRLGVQWENSAAKKELTKGPKVRVPTLTFGCEAWTLQARHKGQVQATQMRVGVSRLNRVRESWG